MVVANDGTGSAEWGYYAAAVGHEGRHQGRPGCWLAVERVSYHRKQSVWLLIRGVLGALFARGKRSDRGDGLLESGREPEANPAEACRVCGCTDLDCRGCIERTGEPCYWVEPGLCSACAGEQDDKLRSEMEAEGYE